VVSHSTMPEQHSRIHENPSRLCGFAEQTADELLQNAVETDRSWQTVADSTATGVEVQDRGDTCR